jgi:hypothetical protein
MLIEVGSSRKLELIEDAGEAVLDSFLHNGMPIIRRAKVPFLIEPLMRALKAEESNYQLLTSRKPGE